MIISEISGRELVGGARVSRAEDSISRYSGFPSAASRRM
jgi:hypothetical protein